MTNELAKPRNDIETHGGVLQCRTLDDMWRYAQYICKSGLVPKAFDTPEKCLICVQFGAELGFSAMQSFQAIYVHDGKPSLYCMSAKAKARSSGLIEVFKEWLEKEDTDDMVACCQVKRIDSEETITTRFSVSDAKKAGLWNKTSHTGRPSPWMLYPKDMLQFKATARALRRMFADVLLGVSIKEDLDEIESTPVEFKKITGPSVADPLLKQAIGAVVSEVPIETKDSQTAAPDQNSVGTTANNASVLPPSETSNRALLEEAQKKEDASLAEKQKAMAASGDTGKKKRKSAPAEEGADSTKKADATVGASDEPQPETREYVCRACQDTGKNSRGKPCPICQKPDKANGDPFTAEPEPENETVAQIAAFNEGKESVPLEELRARCNGAWKLLNEEQQRTVMTAMQVKELKEFKAFGTLQLKNLLSECLSVVTI